jgi:hypothetical protein
MGRGSRNQALTARELLYGRPARGSGPTLDSSLDSRSSFKDFFNLLADNKLRIAASTSLAPQLSGGSYGEDEFGFYTSANIDGIWPKTAILSARQSRDGYSSIAIDYGDQEETIGSDREREFWRSLSGSLRDNHWLLFSPSNQDRLDSFVQGYGSSNISLAYSEGEVSDQAEALTLHSDLEALDDFQSLVLRSGRSFDEVWQSPVGREALRSLADSGDIDLALSLQDF